MGELPSPPPKGAKPAAVLRIWKMWKKPGRLCQLGINHEWAMKFAWSRKGGWRLSCSPVMGMTVTEKRLKQRGYLSFKDYYHQIRQTLVAL